MAKRNNKSSVVTRKQNTKKKPANKKTTRVKNSGKDLLGFESKVPFDEGIKRQVEIFNMMADWYKNMEETI